MVSILHAALGRTPCQCWFCCKKSVRRGLAPPLFPPGRAIKGALLFQDFRSVGEIVFPGVALPSTVRTAKCTEPRTRRTPGGHPDCARSRTSGRIDSVSG